MRTLRTATLSLLAVLAVFLPGVAFADSLTRYGTVGDVRITEGAEDGEPAEPPSAAVPSRTIGDILRMRIDHNATSVKVVVQFKALVAGGFYHRHQVEIRTSSVTRLVLVDARIGGWKGEVELADQNRTPVVCVGLKHLIEYKTARLTVTVPRTCLKSPTSVRVGALTRIQDGIKSYYYDQAQVSGGIPPLSTSFTGLALSPAVTR